MKRNEAYDALFKLKKERNLDISECIATLASSSKVPESVEKFIENNTSRTFNDFITIISKTKHFFNNIVFNYEDDVDTYIKALLSLLTHIKITLEKNSDLREDFTKAFDIDEIIKVISDNIKYGNNAEEVIQCARKIKVIYLNQDEEV